MIYVHGGFSPQNPVVQHETNGSGGGLARSGGIDPEFG